METATLNVDRIQAASCGPSAGPGLAGLETLRDASCMFELCTHQYVLRVRAFCIFIRYDIFN